MTNANMVAADHLSYAERCQLATAIDALCDMLEAVYAGSTRAARVSAQLAEDALLR